MDYKTQGTQLQNLLGLQCVSVALAFRATPPPNVQRISHHAPAGCGYWRLAAEGQVFCTEGSDHYDCPIGAHTHGIELAAEPARELERLIGMMARIEYMHMEEVPTIPRRRTPFGVAIYAPLTATPVDPDVVLVWGNPKQMMLVAEAVYAAGIRQDMTLRLRPTCAIVPEAAEAGRAGLSFGCIGNRIYTGLADEELYVALPGAKVAALLEKLETIITANRELEAFHRERKAAA